MSIDTRTYFSPDRMYRYCLWRCWGNVDADEPYIVFVGLNPSVADEQNDDPTIRRCVGFAKREGMSALCMLNLFAFAATDPKAMKGAIQPIGPNWGEHFRRCVSQASKVVCAWGTHGAFDRRDKEVGQYLVRLVGEDRVVCLGTTKDGHPKHPLYIRADQPLIPYIP